MTKEIDSNYRPNSYFRPQKIETYLISEVKSAFVRSELERLLAEGREEEVKELLESQGVSLAAQKSLEAVHPMFMGGNYLPDKEPGEVEVARIEISSTTCDVTCLFAKKIDGRIHLRVVDEYEGDTLSGQAEMIVDSPLTLGEMTDFFLNAWSLIEVLEMNFETDVEDALGFFSAKSEFYPEFDDLCRERVVKAFPEPEPDEEDYDNDDE